MENRQFKKYKMPDNPGVYFFKKGKDILYIGKATSLRDRVKSYFDKNLIETRGPMLLDMVTIATSIKWQMTDNVLEALILEANLIKKYQPKYNTKEKDNKSFNYVCISRCNTCSHPFVSVTKNFPLYVKERKNYLPKVLIVRGRNLEKEKYDSVFGPFPNGSQLKEAMKIIRRIFPYIDEQSSKKNNKEFYKQLGLAPNFEFVLLSQYKKNIKNLKLFFEGKKKNIITNLKKDMIAFSKSKDFENAARIRDQIFALNHINDVSLIKENVSIENAFQKVLGRGGREPAPDHFEKHFRSPLRIEAYDIAHMSGKNMVGVMTVIENGELIKSEYKKFIIKTQTGSNDTGALEEVLSRRFRHTEWGLPNLIVMDGSIAQINIAKSVLNRYQFKIPVVSVVKDDKHKAKAIMGDESLIKKYKKEILLINSESHRFAIAFHKQKRNKNFLKN